MVVPEEEGVLQQPQTIEALKTNNHQQIRRIFLEMCGNVIANFTVRVAAVIHKKEARIEHVINY